MSASHHPTLFSAPLYSRPPGESRVCLLPLFSELPLSSQAIPGIIPSPPLLPSHLGFSLMASTMPSPRGYSPLTSYSRMTHNFVWLMMLPFLKYFTCLCFSSFQLLFSLLAGPCFLTSKMFECPTGSILRFLLHLFP